MTRPSASRMSSASARRSPFEHVQRRGRRHRRAPPGDRRRPRRARRRPRARAPGEPALLVVERAAHDGRDLLVGSRAPRRQTRIRDRARRVDLEVGVLGRRADERDRAVLDVGQEGVLLGLVESMDLVEEQDRPRAIQGDPLLRLGDRARTSATPAMTAESVEKCGPDLAGQQAGRGSSCRSRAGPTRSDSRGGRGRCSGGEAALADEVLLADELVEAPRAHPGGQRLALGRGLEQRLRAGA